MIQWMDPKSIFILIPFLAYTDIYFLSFPITCSEFTEENLWVRLLYTELTWSPHTLYNDSWSRQLKMSEFKLDLLYQLSKFISSSLRDKNWTRIGQWSKLCKERQFLGFLINSWFGDFRETHFAGGNHREMIIAIPGKWANISRSSQ